MRCPAFVYAERHLMLGFIIQRFLQAVVVMAVMSVIVFCGINGIDNILKQCLCTSSATRLVYERTDCLSGKLFNKYPFGFNHQSSFFSNLRVVIAKEYC